MHTNNVRTIPLIFVIYYRHLRRSVHQIHMSRFSTHVVLFHTSYVHVILFVVDACVVCDLLFGSEIRQISLNPKCFVLYRSKALIKVSITVCRKYKLLVCCKHGYKQEIL